MPGVITCGPGEGDAVGICIPGVITCRPGEGDGDGMGICIPGVITCGLGDGEGFGFAVPWLALLLAGVVVFFFGAARLGFGFAAGGLGMTCPSCCGNALPPLSANTSAKEKSVRILFQLRDRFIIPPIRVRR